MLIRLSDNFPASHGRLFIQPERKSLITLQTFDYTVGRASTVNNLQVLLL